MTIENVVTIVGVLGGIDIVSLISMIIAILSYRRKVKKEDMEEAKHQGKIEAKIDGLVETSNETKKMILALKEHDEAEAEERKGIAVELAALKTKINAHINNKQIHSYKRR